MPRGGKPKPPGTAKHRNPVAHPWQPAPGEGWQHGDPRDKRRKYPKPPDGLIEDSRRAWDAWMRSWWASFWAAADLPQIELAILKYDEVRRGSDDINKLTPLLDRLGITPKGRQDLRWAPLEEEKPAPAATADEVAQRREERRKKLA